MDRPGEGRAPAGPSHHPGADPAAGGPRGRRELRRGGGPGKAGPPRRYEPRLRLRPAVPRCRGHYPSGGYLLLRGGQHRYSDPPGCLRSGAAQVRSGIAEPLRLCGAV